MHRDSVDADEKGQAAPEGGICDAKPQRQLREDRSNATREKVLDGAYRVLLELGHAGLRSSNISEAAGVSRGGMLHHYPAKEDVVAALYVRLMNDLEDASWKTIEDTADADLVDGIINDCRQRFLTETYTVILDILIASSEEKLVADALESLSVDERLPARAGWVNRFIDAGVDHEIAAKITSLIWNAIKGLAVRNVVVQDSVHADRVISLLRMIADDVCGDVLRKTG